MLADCMFVFGLQLAVPHHTCPVHKQQYQEMAGRSPTQLVLALALVAVLVYLFKSKEPSEESSHLKQRDQAPQTPKEDVYHWKTSNSQRGMELITVRTDSGPQFKTNEQHI